jgi:hypothetical protein
MAYPLIILGAGASYDSIDIQQYAGTNKKGELERFRPPLTYKLFDHSRELFQNILDKYSRVNALAGGVLARLADKQKTFEEVLQGFYDEHKVGAENRQERVLKELISLNYYLADLFINISDNFHMGDNNYIRLINEMHNRLMKAYVINFNYDLIFETSANKDLSNLNSYITGDIKILKVHGACNWVYAPVTIRANTYKHAESYFADNADQFFGFFKNENISVDRPQNYLRNVTGGFGEPITNAYMPALAIPLNKKSQTVCPKTHIDEFEKNIDIFDRIIIIGWRGSDEFIINELNEKLGDKKLTTFVITKDPDLSNRNEEQRKILKDAIKQRYAKIPQLIIKEENIYLEGFSKFMQNYSHYSRILEKTIPAIMS